MPVHEPEKCSQVSNQDFLEFTARTNFPFKDPKCKKCPKCEFYTCRARALRGASRENTKDHGRGRVVVSFVPYKIGPWPGLVSNEFYARA